jgi:hypothetical protein
VPDPERVRETMRAHMAKIGKDRAWEGSARRTAGGEEIHFDLDVLSLEPGDLLVIHLDGDVRTEDIQRIGEAARKHLDGGGLRDNLVVVTTPEMQIEHVPAAMLDRELGRRGLMLQPHPNRPTCFDRWGRCTRDTDGDGNCPQCVRWEQRWQQADTTD